MDTWLRLSLALWLAAGGAIDGLAENLRREVREQLQRSASDDRVIAFMTDRYGDFVRYRQPFKARATLPWFGPAALHQAGTLDAAQYTEARQVPERRIVDAVVNAPAAATAAAPTGNAHAVTPEQIQAMTDKLVARLKDNPGDADGWAMLGRSLAVLGRHNQALPALKKAVELRGDDAVLLADYADALRHWQKLAALAPGNELVQQIQGSIDEARQRAGGAAPAQAGDLRGFSAPVAPSAAGLKLQITEVVAGP